MLNFETLCMQNFIGTAFCEETSLARLDQLQSQVFCTKSFDWYTIMYLVCTMNKKIKKWKYLDLWHRDLLYQKAVKIIMPIDHITKKIQK